MATIEQTITARKTGFPVLPIAAMSNNSIVSGTAHPHNPIAQPPEGATAGGGMTMVGTARWVATAPIASFGGAAIAARVAAFPRQAATWFHRARSSRCISERKRAAIAASVRVELEPHAP